MIEGQEGVSWEQWRALACAAEGVGLEGLFRSDHYLSILRGPPAGSLDAWATLAAIAATTTRIRLGTMVSPVSFRHASVLAKNAVTVDHVSGGRVELGIGGGWYEAEHEAYGFDFGTTPRPARRARPPARRDPPPVGRGQRRVAEAVPAPAAADHRRRRREAAHRRGRDPLRRRVQHGLPLGRGRPRAAAHPRRRRPQGRPQAARLLDDGRLRRRPRPRRGARAPRALAARSRISRAPNRPFAGRSTKSWSGYAPMRQAGVERAMLQHLAHEDLEMVTLLGDIVVALNPGGP